MPRSRDATVSCGCSGDEDEASFDDYGLDNVQFLANSTPPEGFFSPDSEMGPEVGSPMNITGLVVGTPEDVVNIPSFNVETYYDDQGNLESEQHYSEAEEDFLNKTIQSPASQSRRSSRSAYGKESPSGTQYNQGYVSDSQMPDTPPGFQYKKGRKAGLWDNENRRGTGCGGGSPCSKSPESNYEVETPPGFQYKKGRKAQLWGNSGAGGERRPRTSPASSPETRRTERPAARSGRATLIPVPAPRSAGSRYQESPEYDQETTADFGSFRPARTPINYQKQNIDNLKKYPDPRYTYVPKHKFPGKSPIQRRSEPDRLRRDIASEDLDVSDIPIDANIHPHRRETVEPMVGGMLSHVCGARGGYNERTRPPISGINQSIYGGRFACPALAEARTWLPSSPSDDDVQVIHSPRPGRDMQDDDDELAEFEELEQMCNNASTSSRSSPKIRDKSCQSPECIALSSDSGTSSPRTPKSYHQTSDLIDFRSDSGRKAPRATSRFEQSRDIFDISGDSGTSSPKTPKRCNQIRGSSTKTKKKPQRSPEIVDLCDDSFEDMEKKVLEGESDGIAEESAFGLYPNYSQLTSSMMDDTAYGVVDLNTVQQLVREENNDVSVAAGLSMPSRVNTTLGQSAANISVSSVCDGKSNVSAAGSRSSAHASMNLTQGGKSNMSAAANSSTASKNSVTWGRNTAAIPVMAEDRVLDHTFAANMTMVQEQGLSLTSPPHQIVNLIFPPDEGECQITAIIDSVPLEGAIVPMRPSRIRLPPTTTEKMDELAVIADSFIRSAPDRAAGAQLNVTLGTSLNVTVIDIVSPDATLDESNAGGSPASSPGRGTGNVSSSVEASRSIAAINSGRLVGETDFVMNTSPEVGTWIQLRGHREPNWFPGYYASLPSLPSPVTLLRTASELLPRAWYATQSDSFQEDYHLSFRA